MADSSLEQSRTPTVAPPAASDAAAKAPAVPQRAGNAAAQARLGLAAPAPGVADTLTAALDAMGELGAVVLDAMPLAQALRLARSAGRGTAWAAAWVREQSAADLLVHGADLLGAGFDAAWPVGFGAKVDVAGSGALLGKLTGATSYTIARSAAGMSFTAQGAMQAGVGIGAGLKLTGSKDDVALGGSVDANALAGVEAEATWAFPTLDVLRAFATRDPRTLDALLLGEDGVEAALVPVLTALAESVAPTAWSTDARVREDASASTAVLGAVSADAGVRADGGVKVGQEGGASYVEASMGGSVGVRDDNKLFEALRVLGLPKLALTGGIRFRIRATGTQEDVSSLKLEKLSFLVGASLQVGDTTVEDTYETADVDAAIGWMTAVMFPLATRFAEKGPAVPAAELPDVALTRSTTRAVDDLRDIADVDVVDELLEWVTPDAHCFLTAETRATLTGTVRVPVEAVAAALAGAPLPAGPEGIEARVLDVARIIAAEATGGSTFRPVGLPELDLAAGVAEVEMPAVEATVEWEARAGLGGEVGLVAGLEAGVNAGLTLSQTGTLSSAIDAEQRIALFAS